MQVQAVESFLQSKGFKKITEESYANNKCMVTHIPKSYSDGSDNYYVIETIDGLTYSHNFIVYELVGYLIYFDLI